MNRCKFEHSDLGPRCCVETEAPGGAHDGTPHLFKCAGASCPGLPWPASESAHPAQCAEPIAAVRLGAEASA